MIAEKLYALASQAPVVPVFYEADAARACELTQACYEGGLRIVEFTNRGEAALTVFPELVRYVRQHCPDMLVGIGTILTADQAEDFMEAGADFVVQPVTTAEVGKVCARQNIPWIPGAMTPTEIYQATLLGASLVKVFPGSAVGPGYVKAIKAPMPQLRLMITGGVEPTPESVQAWLGAGASAVGIGSQLFSGGEPDAIRNRIQTLLSAIRS